jgi:CheY-like chemotaxis protein
VLLVEDDPTNRFVVTSVLTKAGYQVDSACNGLEAVSALEHADYSLVLMDCMMPEMNGYEATAIVRDPASMVRNHAIPIIALTAKVLRDDREQCLAAGMDDYLSKPVVVPDLLRMVEKWDR